MSKVVSAAAATGAMVEPARVSAERYYDDRVAEKLRDFTEALPRIEAAIETLAEWAPTAPRRVLEIGCGVGATSWRMARAWPSADVTGTDFSRGSIEVAKACFRRPNLDYRAGRLAELGLTGAFDLILMMDVYEHIAPSERPALQAELSRLLSPESRLLLMVPTPAHQAWLREHDPAGLQPVDEDIHPADILRLGEAVGARLLHYREVGIWRYGDYFHAVLGRTSQMEDAVALRQPRASGVAAAKLTARRLAGRAPPAPEGLSDQLGTDLLRPEPRAPAKRFAVPAAERRRLAAAWTARTGG